MSAGTNVDMRPGMAGESSDAPPGGVLVLNEHLHAELLELATAHHESGAVLLARVTRTPSGRARLVATELHTVPDDAYTVRGHDRLEITSEGYVPALARADATGAVALWVHTHPGEGSPTQPSIHDVEVNRQLHDVFGLRTGSDAYGWLVCGHDNGLLTFTGEVELPSSALGIDGTAEAITLTSINVVGPRLRRISHQAASTGAVPELLNRNIRALGWHVQRVIRDMTIAVVGCGGTGSAVAEQLLRLGARHLILIDPEDLAISNVTRVYGSTIADVDRPKVELVAEHLRRIAGSEAQITPVAASINDEETARLLLEADVVFGCTDDNAGRLRLSRLPYYHSIPVIDCGVQLTSDANDVIDGIFGRVTICYPGSACLVCRDRIDLRLADAEQRPAAEREGLAAENYAPALPGVEPALVPFTTLVASHSVGELIERLIGYGEEPVPSEVLLLAHDRRVSTNTIEHRADHYCDPARAAELREHGMFLGLNWTS